MISGMWLACNMDPVLYVPGAGKMWLIDSRWDGMILKDCAIYRPGKGLCDKQIKRGYEPHCFKCSGEEDRSYGRTV
jgi:hypothetical protein